MILVVVAAMTLWAVRLLMLSAAYREKAGRYQLELMGATPILMGPHRSHSLGYPRSARSRWAERMADKYLHASRVPWLRIEPDLPVPE
jgi:hypothetical protein